MENWLEQWRKRYDLLKNQWNSTSIMNEQQLKKLENDTEFVLETWMEMEDKIADLKEEMEEDQPQRVNDALIAQAKLPKIEKLDSKGVTYFSLDMFDKAIIEIEQELKNQNCNPKLRLYLGYAYLYTKNIEKAKEHFIFLLHLHQTTFEKHFAYVGLGCLYGQQQEYEQAIYFFEKALTLTSNTDVVYNLGICYLLLQRPQLALPYFKKLNKELPEDAEVYYLLGHCYMKIGHETKAFEAWYTALQLIEYKDLLVTLAYEFEQYGHYLVAIHCYKRLLAIGFNDHWVNHGIAWNYGLLDERLKAKKLFNHLLTMDPRNENIWISYLWLLSKWNETNELHRSIELIEEQKISHPLINRLLSLTN